jgi:hypothetical protein
MTGRVATTGVGGQNGKKERNGAVKPFLPAVEGVK